MVCCCCCFPSRCVKLAYKTDFCLHRKRDNKVEGLLFETKAVCLYPTYHWSCHWDTVHLVEGSVSCSYPEQPWVLNTGASSVYASFQPCLLGPSPVLFSPSGQPSPLRMYRALRPSSRADSDPPDSALRRTLSECKKYRVVGYLPWIDRVTW